MINPKDKPIRFILQSLLLIFSSLALLSCGGGGGGGSPSGGDSNPGIGAGDATAGVAPITALTSSESHTIPVSGQAVTVAFESGFDGAIEVVTAAVAVEFVNQTFKLANGTPSMNVADLQRTMAFDLSCSDGKSLKGTSSANYKTGVVTNNATLNGQPLACSSMFQSILTTTISDEKSITDLLLDWGSDDNRNNAAQTGLLETDCPQDNDSDFRAVNPFFRVCTGSMLSNYTVTDDAGGIHKLATRLSFSSGSPGSLPDGAPGAPGNLPDGIPQLPDGIPQFPDGVPQLPDGFPFPDGVPQFPDGFPVPPS